MVLMVGHGAEGGGHPLFVGPVQIVAGIAAGFVIGVVASLLGVAGGELLIPTLILLFGADVKLAGSLSLAVSLPTMLVGFARRAPLFLNQTRLIEWSQRWPSSSRKLGPRSNMPPRRHSAHPRGRRHDLGIGVRDMAAGLGVGMGRLLTMEDGTASEEDKTFYRTWLSRIEGWSDGERHLQLKGASSV
jgi:hypothetical protein